ncbi:CATRA system-associated protein [Actinocrispum wychmicini]|uniref:CobQ/CobB/MinD/ParA family nucleotide binding protein n=1 Tax=Actinocrispum wychmicini TaxID=1213861 RepID=A0A4R2JFZ8_9PSEU|nr:CATRA system-associated protein [Actinocrispum wychmicini]TCO55826.1 CobQ/CobB/MinD/ParA family nucleotide binding protein [Actinocrispum wychmicini]
MPGTVVTFYSYKGGVGRSFALANIAVLLARWGHRVLCVDWDLEAPGLHHYFRPMFTGGITGGVVDLVDDFLAGMTQPVDHTIRLSTTGTLSFVAAGREDADYVRQVQEIDWDLLYDQGFGHYLEQCRDRWTTDYDYVLLDSRTGVSDIGSVCTAHLPDRLVVLFTANVQSIRGAVDIARRANEARDGLPYDRAQLTVLPVLSMFDTREEYDRSEEWRRKCASETEVLFRNWLHREVQTELISRHMTLPYVSYWSFGEQLPVRSEANPSADQIGFALETVAAVVAHGFDRTDLLAENRDAYVAAARGINRTFVHDLRVSSPRPTLDVAQTLIDELNSRDVRAVLSLSGDRSLLTDADDDARHLCLVVDGELTRWQSADVELFLHRTLGQDRRVIPVLAGDADANALPGYVGNLRYLRLSPTWGPAEVAQDLADQLNGAATHTEPDDVDPVDVLRRTARSRLHPATWQVVADIVDALLVATLAEDDPTVRELAAGLALVIRPRAGQPANQHRTTAAPDVQAAMTRVVRILEARVDGARQE